MSRPPTLKPSRRICDAALRVLTAMLLLVLLGCGGGSGGNVDLDVDLDAFASAARRYSGGTDPALHPDFRSPRPADIAALRNGATLHILRSLERREGYFLNSCANGYCRHLDSIQAVIAANYVPVMRTGQGIDLGGGYRYARGNATSDTYHLFYGTWMEHGLVGVYREETWYDYDINQLQTPFASMTASNAPPTGDATYAGAVWTVVPADWEQSVRQGTADIRYHLDSNTVDVTFSRITSLNNGVESGSLSWTEIPVRPDGSFLKTGEDATPGPLGGSFAGPGATEVMGVFEASIGGYDHVPGAFGARRLP